MGSPSPGHRLRTGLTNSGLVVVGLVGLAVIAWYVLSFLTGARLVVFMTGSMAPDLPTGSGAISVPVAASDLEVGDVVTLQRDDASLPVTHRIVEVNDGSLGSSYATRSLVLQGDDNPVPDQFPYVVEEAHRMVVGAPHVGALLEQVRSPWAIMALTVVVAALVLSVFWPERDEESGDSDVPTTGLPASTTEPLA